MTVPISSNIGPWIGTTIIPNVASPVPYAVSVQTNSSQCLAASPPGTRHALFFYNASSTNSVWICPAQLGDGTPLTAAVNGAGCMAVFPLTGVPLSGSALTAWNAVATDSNTPLTIWEFRIAP